MQIVLREYSTICTRICITPISLDFVILKNNQLIK